MVDPKVTEKQIMQDLSLEMFERDHPTKQSKVMKDLQHAVGKIWASQGNESVHA